MELYDACIVPTSYQEAYMERHVCNLVMWVSKNLESIRSRFWGYAQAKDCMLIGNNHIIC